MYLVTITLINLALGTAVAGAMWATGLPNPPLWGGMVAILNFVPYLGPLLSFSVISLASIATFKTFGQAWPSPAAFLVLVTLEGQFLTPTLAARRLTLNPIAIFIAISFCGFLWNVPGALLAVPLLAVTKIICDNMRVLNPIGEFLGN
jgi:predicted PurR-regulated permease PerM